MWQPNEMRPVVIWSLSEISLFFCFVENKPGAVRAMNERGCSDLSSIFHDALSSRVKKR